jgi:ankyrin repeat protein
VGLAAENNNIIRLTALSQCQELGLLLDDVPGDVPLIRAASSGIVQHVQLLCDAGFDSNNTNPDGVTARTAAAEGGFTEIIQVLVDQYGADPNLSDNGNTTALMVAAENGQLHVVELLLNTYSVNAHTTDRQGWTALLFAARVGERVLSSFWSITTYHLPIEERSKYGETALMIASSETI